jgi:hypothetical protein
MQPGDLVEFDPDRLTYGPDNDGLIGMLGLVTEIIPDAGAPSYAHVLWTDGMLTDTHLNDLTLVQRAHADVQ